MGVGSPERQYIIDVLRRFVHKRACSPPTAEIDLQKLECLLIRNKLIPLFYSLLPKGVLSDECTGKWHRQSVEGLFNYAQATRASIELFGVLEAEGVPSVALRGMALAERLYDEPAQRPMADVDVQIHSNTKDAVVGKLQAHGLVLHKQLRSQFVYLIGNTKFELHWSFLTPKRYRKVADFNQWISQAESTGIMGGRIPCLKPEHELIELVCHGFIHHEFDRVLQLVDIALLLKKYDIDWNEVGKWARAASLALLFGFALGYVDRFFGLGLGDELAKAGLGCPQSSDALFEAYTASMFLEDNRGHYFRRKKNLVDVAEKKATKARQLIRFIDAKELGKMMAVQKRGGMGG